MRLSDVVFLEVEDVERAHTLSLARFGGLDGIRDPGLLASAVAAVRSGYYTTLVELAAVYAHGIAKNHPFLDGNKRTALSAAGMFLGANGFDLVLGLEWVGYIEQLAAGTLSREDLVFKFAEAVGDKVALED